MPPCAGGPGALEAAGPPRSALQTVFGLEDALQTWVGEKAIRVAP